MSRWEKSAEQRAAARQIRAEGKQKQKGSMNLFSPLPEETRRILAGISGLIDKTFPLPGRFRSALPGDIAGLSRLLTSARGGRSLSYLGRPNLLSAYLRYFLPWNLYRLCRLLPALPLSLAENDTVTDLGSGPLTFVIALWISRPDLRKVPLEFRCIDRSGPALEAGKKLFHALSATALSANALSGENSPWKIRAIKGNINIRAAPAGVPPQGVFSLQARPGSGGKNALVCAANMFNEVYGAIPHSDAGGLMGCAENSAAFLAGLAADTASILVVEPGVPQSGQFISLLRNALMERGRPPLSPCPQSGPCPLPGGLSAAGRGPFKSGKNRWCHFAFETEDAPGDLRRLSAAAGIPKERAVLAFLLAGPEKAEAAPAPPKLLIISDSVPLPANRFGRYGCSTHGLVLAAGKKETIENTPSGSLIDIGFTKPEQRDPRSGALIVEL
jgi:hypothetical protein